MEDAHLYAETQLGVLAAVFDGHNGDEVAIYAADRLKNRFFSLPELSEGAVYEAFLALFSEIQREIEEEHPDWAEIGSTAAVCYLEKKTNYVYTATMGDTEACLYRPLKKRWRSIPLSCIRNWSTKRDALSAEAALGEKIPWKKNPKEMRHPPQGESVRSGYGLNVSRAFGDAAFKGVIHCPKITVTTLLPGDILLLACDGVKDFVSEKELVELITIHQGRPSLVPDLVDYALFEKDSMDNVTALGVFIH